VRCPRAVAITRCDCVDLEDLKRFDSPISHTTKEAAAKLLDNGEALNYNACQAITG
jgi:hypothetical protein